MSSRRMFTSVPASVSCFRDRSDTTFSRHALSCLPGTVTTEPAGERHANRMCGNGAHVLVVQPDPARIEALGCAADLFDGIHHVADAGVAGTAWRIARELRAPDDLAPLAIEGLVLDMLVSAARTSAPASGEGRSAPAWFVRAEELVQSRFREPLRIAGITEAVGVHPAHLARAFRVRTGVSIGLYVRRLRCDSGRGAPRVVARPARDHQPGGGIRGSEPLHPQLPSL